MWGSVSEMQFAQYVLPFSLCFVLLLTCYFIRFAVLANRSLSSLTSWVKNVKLKRCSSLSFTATELFPIQNPTVNLIIEYFWCHSKRYAWQHCNSIIERLRENVPTALAQVVNQTILGSSNSYLKKMELYWRGVAYGSGELMEEVDIAPEDIFT